jgi:23S rRNA (pseudouridine1915-N3)-methyltransferase
VFSAENGGCARPDLAVHLIAVGRLRGGPEKALFDRYDTRLRPRLTVAEVAEARGTAVEVKRREGVALLAAVPKDGFVVALDLGGQMLGSEAFSARLRQWARTACFVIGGAEGLDAAVLERAGFVLSLGAMTWPHFLVRAMLAEQIYRAHSIAAGHPYHRAGRP